MGRVNHQVRDALPGEQRLAWILILPALIIMLGIVLFPVTYTFWESLHLHDLRMPWRSYRFMGLQNYAQILQDGRFYEAMIHTIGFTIISVGLELVLGLVLALSLNRSFRGRGLGRAVSLLPWAIPTVVAALLWRFLFDDQFGLTTTVLTKVGLLPGGFVWFTDAIAAWVPVILADVWKTTPFVALLLLAGLQSIDGSLYEAARVDGASSWKQFLHITLPMLKPAIVVALIFRTLDAFRVFDLIYVLTGGGPGTSTEPIALYTFTSLLQNLRFGFGSALSIIIFLVVLSLALVYIRVSGLRLAGEEH
jgi:ABC-type sugar transport system permease subunit